MSSLSWKAGLASFAIVAATAYAVAQMPSGHSGVHSPVGGDHDAASQGAPHGSMHGHMMEMMQGMMRGHQGMHDGMGRQSPAGMQSGAAGQPTRPGQEAFGAILEVVQILEADPTTDWSRVNIAALREHLIDMSEVTLRAMAA